MNFKYKRRFAAILTFIYILSLTPHIASADDDLLSFTFENEDEISYWTGAVLDEECAYEGTNGINVSNPYGDPNTGVFGHILGYNRLVHLEEGRFYTFSAYVSDPFADDVSEPSASAYMVRDSQAICIEISGIGFNWGFVTASFMACETVDAEFSVTLNGGDIDIGFFMDNIFISPEERKPSYSMLEGQNHVFIPDTGYAEYRYNIVTYDEDNLPINILAGDLMIDASDIPDGVEFDPSSGLLRVYSSAEPESSFTITCSSIVGVELKSSSKTITVTKNLLSDPGFEQGEENWISDSSISYNDNMISLYADEKGDYGFFANVIYTKQLLLRAGNMYVFRADVGSDEEFDPSFVYISNLSFASSGYAEINITGIGGEWTNVTSAFMVEDSGLYDLTINLYAPSERPIYIDNVYLGVEESLPTSISIHAPGHVCIPSDTIILPCYAVIRNQLGEAMDEYDCELTLSPSGKGVYLENGEIIVSENAAEDDYTVTAVFDDIISTHTISVSYDYVGDGGFETKQPNEWWTSSEGSFFSIIEYNGSKAGHIYSPDRSCILVNNSYMELIEGEYYVYSAAAGFGEGTVTAFIADYETGEYIPFAQYDPLKSVRIPFSLDRKVMGRLVLYIESDDFVGLILDDIAIEKGELSVSEVTVSEGGHGNFIRGSYVYNNNMTDEADADISATRWYISSSFDGSYQPVGTPNQSYLEFTPDMIGQYIIYEVTPICAYTGLEGDIIRSFPFCILGENENNSDTDPILSQLSPIELENVKEHSFSDITSHWAEDKIASLSNAGIVSGKGAHKFDPDSYITRAEFTAMVARAFSLVSVPYSGTFDDISDSDWYSGIIEAAYRRGIIFGVSDNIFAPNERITREQMAAIITRAYLLCNGPLPYEMGLKYYDSFLISPWAYESVKMSSNLNLFTGDDMNLFRPLDNATRAEAAVCIYRALKSFQF